MQNGVDCRRHFSIILSRDIQTFFIHLCHHRPYMPLYKPYFDATTINIFPSVILGYFNKMVYTSSCINNIWLFYMVLKNVKFKVAAILGTDESLYPCSNIVSHRYLLIWQKR